MSDRFQFKQFSLIHARSTMKTGTDAVLLGAAMQPPEQGHILEVGCGCGVISLMQAQRSNAIIHAIDIDQDSVEEASANFALSPWSKRLKAIHSSLQQYAVSCRQKYDLVISNPPYFTNALKNPSANKALARHNDKLPFDELMHYAAKLLLPEGRIQLVLPASEQNNICRYAEKYGLSLKRIINIHPKPDKAANRIITEFSFAKISQPENHQLYLRNEGGEYSRDYILLLKDFLIYL
jgi:tRNA1Val (adenine37-N6)-methyltransferase